MIDKLPICEICGKNLADKVIIRRKNGVSAKKLICSFCATGAAERLAPVASEPQRIFRQMLGGKVPGTNCETTCGLCGTRLSSIVAQGRPGCCMCYSVFESQLMLVVEVCQPRRFHVGKTPSR